MNNTYRYERQGRSRTTIVVVLAIWTGLAAGWALIDMAWWIAVFLAAFTLPAIWDHVTNPLSGLTLTATDLSWFSGRRSGRVTLDEIAQVRLDTRLDFSVRATLILTTGQKLRLPFEATPPHEAFEAALQDRGIATRRYHFQLFQ